MVSVFVKLHNLDIPDKDLEELKTMLEGIDNFQDKVNNIPLPKIE